MKKTSSLVLALTFVFALVLQVPVLAENNSEASKPMLISIKQDDTTNLEKIPSPAHINLFEKIKKVGTDLFGVRKASTTATAVEKKIEELKQSGLEKIISLEQVKFFDKITKVGNDLFGIKKPGTIILPAMTPELITCVSSAIDAKDTSISVSFTNAAAEITSAIEVRGTCQKEALTLNSDREGALKICNKDFQEATKVANDRAKKAQQETWVVYKNSLKDCSSKAKTGDINIEDGGDILK